MPPTDEPSNGTNSTDAEKPARSSSSVESAEGAAGGMADSMNVAVEEAAANASEAIATEGGNEDGKAKKRKERLEQNRISARESRKRKKTMIEELQRTVITLSNENKELTDRNDHLRTQLMEIASKYPNVVPLQAIMNGAPGAQVGVPPGAQQLQQQQQQQQQAAAVAAAAQATFNPLAYWPQQAAAAAAQQQGLPQQQQPPPQQQMVSQVHMAPAVTPLDTADV